MSERSFQDIFSNAYSRAKASPLAKDAEFRESILSKAAGKLGHPDFEHLVVGQTKESQGVVFFLDIRGFTKLSFVLPNRELLWILQALTQASVVSVMQFGGHVIEFTGDGIMSVFGDSHLTAEAAAFAALQTTAFLMSGIRDTVNPQLEHAGTEPVRTAVGMEFGDILWARIGVYERTQVKPISEATFLAGKLSTSITKSWEAKVGGNLAGWIPDDFKVQVPKFEFVADGIEYSRELYLFKWEQFGRTYALQTNELRKSLLERKLSPGTPTSPYLDALKALTVAGYNVVLDETSDCPHLLVDLSKDTNLEAIITFEFRSTGPVPSVYLRKNGQLEKIEIDPSVWQQGNAKLSDLVRALQKPQ